MTTPLTDQHSGAAFQGQLQELTDTMRRAVTLLEKMATVMGSAHEEVEPLPEFGKVRIIGSEGVAAEVTGHMGVILARSLDRRNKWVYTVLVDGVGAIYILSHNSLQYSNESAAESEVYSGNSPTVWVSKSGACKVAGVAQQGRRR